MKNEETAVSGLIKLERQLRPMSSDKIPQDPGPVNDKNSELPRIEVLFEGLPKLNRDISKEKFPQHVCLSAFLKWMRREDIRKALQDTGLDVFLLNLVSIYFWGGRHMCFGERALIKKMRMSCHTLRWCEIVLKQAGILQPIGKKTFFHNWGAAWAYVWSFYADATETTAEEIYNAANLYHFKRSPTVRRRAPLKRSP